MVSPSVGSVVLVRFPFFDLSVSKLRPAVVLAGVDRDDWVLCQIPATPMLTPQPSRLAIQTSHQAA